MARELADRFTADGIDLGRVSFERRGDLRYVGQGYELRVPFPDGPIDEAALAKAFDAFHEIHRREYGHHFADSAIEIVNLRAGRRAPAPPRSPSRPSARPSSLDAALVRTGHLHLPRRRRARATMRRAFYRRDRCRSASASPARRSSCRCDIDRPSCRRHWHATAEADAAGNSDHAETMRMTA